MQFSLAVVSPPAPCAVLRVGVVGHRHDALRFPRALAAPLQDRIAGLLRAMDRAAESVRQVNAEVFAPVRARLCVVSALAEGADRCGARAALQLGLELQVVLPFGRDEYADDFPLAESKEEYTRLLGCASRVFELPGARGSDDASYLLAGRATIRGVDILIAAWDGALANGPGGTADIVDQALQLGVPVVHVDVSGRTPARIRWLGWTDPPSAGLASVAPVPVREFDAGVDELVSILMRPPQAATPGASHVRDLPEQALLRDFLAERVRRWRWRPEQAFFQLLFGGRGVRWTDFRARDYFQPPDGAWGDGLEAARLSEAMRAVLWPRFAFADRLAEHYGQNYRSGYLSNFCLAALAVICSIFGLAVWPGLKTYLVAAELVVLVLIVSNTLAGNRARWHRRWLDYRHLAERLRNLRVTAMLGDLNLIPEPVTTPAPGWVAWYARATAREAGLPCVAFAPSAVSSFGRAFIAAQLDPQIDYHVRNEHHLHLVDHRLHAAGICGFAATGVVCAAYLATALAPSVEATALGELIHHYAAVATIAVPAIATALYGIKTQGEFRSRAERSHRTRLELEGVRQALQAPDYSFYYLLRQVERAGSVMLDDLADWRVTYSRRRLENPA